MVNCMVQVLGLGTPKWEVALEAPWRRFEGICSMSPGQVGGKLSSKGGRWRVVPQVEGRMWAEVRGRNEPSLHPGWRGARPGWRAGVQAREECEEKAGVGTADGRGLRQTHL